jgi:ubiquinone/menaquinone biosynthesis C-methylase UbiE
MSSVGQVTTGFIRLNRRLVRRIERTLGHPPGYEQSPMQSWYIKTVAEYANAQSGQVIVDMGAGMHCHFAALLEPDKRSRIIGVDISAEAMASNDALDEKVVANAEHGLPLPDAEADLVVSMLLLEHLTRVQPVGREIHRVLRPGGYSIHIFPSRNAPFALLNRYLPRRLTRRLLRSLIPGSEGLQGFPAYYDHCSPGEMERLFARSGFRVVRTEWSSYQSDYFGFFLPLYLLSLAYDVIVQRLSIGHLAATVLIVTQKPEHDLGLGVRQDMSHALRQASA